MRLIAPPGRHLRHARNDRPPSIPDAGPPPRRRPRTVVVLAAVSALALAAGVGIFVLDHRHHGAANQTVADAVQVVQLEGRYLVDSETGVLGASSLVGIQVLAPITLLEVRPYSVTRGVETISRAFFWGKPGVTSASGHPLFSGVPGGICFGGPWPPAGYGRSFPAAGLELAAGDPVEFSFYVRPPAVPGHYVITGYRIRYRTARGKVHTITGDHGQFDITVYDSADVHVVGHCTHDRHESWADPFPGYPS